LAVSTTGAPSVSARRRNAVSAFLAPPPERISGRLAALINFAASAIAAASGAGGAALLSAAARPSAGFTMTSVGISICTGPGREEENNAKARASAPGS
jgi:hypothetical protein